MNFSVLFWEYERYRKLVVASLSFFAVSGLHDLLFSSVTQIFDLKRSQDLKWFNFSRFK